MTASGGDQHDWARAYAKQALSDLAVRDLLANSPHVEKCHRLHFLQMSAEKICKAYLVATGNEVRKSHAYVQRVLPIIAREFYSKNGEGNVRQWRIAKIKALAKEIEVLAPACDAGDVREDNSEYPWADGHGKIKVPCEYNFPNLDDSERFVVELVRLIRAAGEVYAT